MIVTVTMDDYTYLSQLIEEDEEVVEEERVLQAAAAAMIIYLGAEEYRALRAQRQQPLSKRTSVRDPLSLIVLAEGISSIIISEIDLMAVWRRGEGGIVWGHVVL